MALIMTLKTIRDKAETIEVLDGPSISFKSHILLESVINLDAV